MIMAANSTKVIMMFLDGTIPEERHVLHMAGGSLMDCTPRELWYLIKERAESTRPYIEYNSEQQEQTLEETVN